MTSINWLSSTPTLFVPSLCSCTCTWVAPCSLQAPLASSHPGIFLLRAVSTIKGWRHPLISHRRPKLTWEVEIKLRGATIHLRPKTLGEATNHGGVHGIRHRFPKWKNDYYLTNIRIAEMASLGLLVLGINLLRGLLHRIGSHSLGGCGQRHDPHCQPYIGGDLGLEKWCKVDCCNSKMS
jgi:hypothetical protein